MPRLLLVSNRLPVTVEHKKGNYAYKKVWEGWQPDWPRFTNPMTAVGSAGAVFHQTGWISSIAKSSRSP